MRPLACSMLSLFLAGSAAAWPRERSTGSTPVEPSAPAAEPTRAVHGRVVTPWGSGISQRIVRIGGQRTFTDGEGRFAFDNVSRTYDVEVMERGGWLATMYYGLSRRDPVLTHQARHAMVDGYLDRRDRPPSTDAGRIAGKVELLKWPYVQADDEWLKFIYVFPDGDLGIDLGGCSPHAISPGNREGCSADGSYAYELPDFSSLGGTYCIAIGNTAGSRAMRCGGKLGMQDFSIAPQPPAPQITIGDKDDADKILSWTGEGEVFELTLRHYSERAFVRVYTNKHSFTWSELAALGVDFAWGQKASVEDIKVNRLLPYQSMDDLVSGRGPFAMGTSWRKVESKDVEIPLPSGFKAAALVPRPRPFNPRDARLVPSCPSSDSAAIGEGGLRSDMVNTRMTVRGRLFCRVLRDMCVDRSCGTDWEWVMAVAGNPGAILRLQRAEDSGSLEDFGGLCGSGKQPTIDVRATGLLISRRSQRPYWKSPEGTLDHLMARARHEGNPTDPLYLLDQATFCAPLSPGNP